MDVITCYCCGYDYEDTFDANKSTKCPRCGYEQDMENLDG